jgi:hypothetical protein
MLACLTLLAAFVSAQSYEIQVYPSATVPKGRTFVELHSNTATRGPVEPETGDRQRDVGAYHETVEITHGFTEWFETGFYTFSSLRSGEGWSWVGNHVRPRARVPAAWGWPVGASLSLEAGWLKPRFSDARWDLEIRPIVDWSRGAFYVSVNPALERGLRFYGDGSRSFSFAPGAKAQWSATKFAAAGVEYYGDIGPVENPSPASEAQHQLGPALDLTFSEDWEFNAGALFGLTRATDALVLKVIVGRRL